MNSVIDPRPLIRSEIIALTLKLKALKLKKMLGLADNEEITKIEKLLAQAKASLRNILPGAMF